MEDFRSYSPEDVIAALTDRAQALYDEQEARFGEEVFREVERVVLLGSVDRHWMDHIDEMDELKGYVGLNSYAQRNPISEYRLQGADMCDEMVASIRDETARKILSVRPMAQPMRRVEVAKPTQAGFAGAPRAPKANAPVRKPGETVVRAQKKVGRNEPCPCGSGKKYKQCCGANPNVYNPEGDK